MRTVLSCFMDPRPLALCRILVGLVAAGFSFEWLRVLVRASSGKFLSIPVIEGWSTPAPGFVWMIFAVSICASVAMVLGLASRLPAILVAATVAAVLLVDQQTYSNHLVLLMMLALFLGLSGAAQTLSVSRAPRAAMVPYWPAFLIKAQITTLYAWTAITKINPQYLSGEVMGTYLHPWIPIPDPLLPAVAFLSIVTEAFLAVALWLPWTRKLAFVLGAGLHLGIVLLLDSPAPLVGFGMLMASGYVLFAWGADGASASSSHSSEHSRAASY
ncbi:HTTM domain-containing protein [Arthrobacter sp. HS15c]|uniref:HTTM domain-containing protein n=1 Tax=Arthrobacter sp. HS15c TaxID=3230279 RepID=UPI00346601D1